MLLRDPDQTVYPIIAHWTTLSNSMDKSISNLRDALCINIILTDVPVFNAANLDPD